MPQAVGDPSPAWPLDHVSRRITRDFMKPRTGTARSSRPGAPRYHVAEDLPAPRGTLILSPEHGTVVVIRDKFYKGTGVMLLQMDSGLVVALGEIEPGSAGELNVVVMSRVSKGQPVARVGWHEMLHLETYREGTRTTHQWWAGEPPPPELLNPTNYLRAAAGSPAPMPTPVPDPEPVVPSRPSPRRWAPDGPTVVAAIILAAAAFS